MAALPYWRLSGYYFFYFAFIGVFSPYFGLYLQALGLSAWDIGLIMSQMQLMRLIGPNVWGWFADRHGRRLGIIRLAAIISLIGFACLFWTTRFAGMLLAMAVLAFFWSAALPLVESLTFDHLRERHGHYSRIRMWGSIGFIVAVMGTGYLLDHLPVANVLWCCLGALAGILAVAVTLSEAGHERAAGPLTSLTQLLKPAAVRYLLAACFAMSVAHGAYYIFYSIHLADHGYSKTAVGLLWSLGVVAEIGVFLIMNRLLARWGVRRILLATFWAAGLRFLLIGWAIDTLWLAIFAQLLHSLTFGAYHAAAISAINTHFAGRAQGRGQALYSSLTFGAGGLLGGLLAGWTWTPLGAGWTFSISAAAAFMGVALVWRAGAGGQVRAR